ncbi:hypothetical protein MPSI1_003817 [Malassezia psittaci]|uniref:Uncharacterized protein n=1 Tax=Malassezia psittaci TaxID=1821823 RepID=A0AAF0FD07_9BASI|nr:hypothetical protein MPSI1_003817 [Malassezia psittaci]
MSTSYSAGPTYSKRNTFIRWSLLALVVTIFASQGVSALPAAKMERRLHPHHPLARAHDLSARNARSESDASAKPTTTQSVVHNVQQEAQSRELGGGASVALNQIFGSSAKGAVVVDGGIHYINTEQSSEAQVVTLTESDASQTQTASDQATQTSSKASSHSSKHHHKSKHHGSQSKQTQTDSSEISAQNFQVLPTSSSDESDVTGVDSDVSSASDVLNTMETSNTASTIGSLVSDANESTLANSTLTNATMSSTLATGATDSVLDSSEATLDSAATATSSLPSSATATATQTSSASEQTSSNSQGGFYRIGLGDGSTAQRIDGDDSDDSDSSDSSVSGGRVAAVESAEEPSGNLPNQSVVTNNPNYGFTQAQNDLYAIRKWAGDLKMLKSKADRNETIMALFNAASRYYPEVDTKVVVRVMLADIKAESDFETNNTSAARLDSGNSVGLVQVSPAGSSDELTEFQKNANADANQYSWTVGKGTSAEVKYGGKSVLGPLLDIDTGKKLNLTKLKKSDLDRPWINLHVAMWLQSNYARTGSQDPSTWSTVSKSSKSVRSAYQPAVLKILGTSSNSSSSSSFKSSTYSSKLKSLQSALKGKNHQKASLATALGSWVAGAAVDSGGYTTSGDDISSQYFSHISEGLSVMYTGSVNSKSKYGKSWLDAIELTPGLIDYL